MSRTAYVNGRYVEHGIAQIHIEDRAVQFADGVYEVCPVRNRTIIDEDRHLKRFHRSLGELDIAAPMSDRSLQLVLREVVRRNLIENGYLYFQASRGIAPRNHVFPSGNLAPSLIVTARLVAKTAGNSTIEVITQPDMRWQRVDIKSLSLLPNVLAREAARKQAAQEAWLVDKDGFVTEGAASNAWIITNKDEIITTPASEAILRGVTRTVILEIAAREGLKFVERRFSPEEAKSAREAFGSSASLAVTPIVKIDGQPVGDGKPGPVSLRLGEELDAFVLAQTKNSGL